MYVSTLSTPVIQVVIDQVQANQETLMVFRYDAQSVDQSLEYAQNHQQQRCQRRPEPRSPYHTRLK